MNDYCVQNDLGIDLASIITDFAVGPSIPFIDDNSISTALKQYLTIQYPSPNQCMISKLIFQTLIQQYNKNLNFCQQNANAKINDIIRNNWNNCNNIKLLKMKNAVIHKSIEGTEKIIVVNFDDNVCSMIHYVYHIIKWYNIIK